MFNFDRIVFFFFNLPSKYMCSIVYVLKDQAATLLHFQNHSDYTWLVTLIWQTLTFCRKRASIYLKFETLKITCIMTALHSIFRVGRISEAQ